LATSGINPEIKFQHVRNVRFKVWYRIFKNK